MKSWYTHQFTTVFSNDFHIMQFDFKVKSGRKWTIDISHRRRRSAANAGSVVLRAEGRGSAQHRLVRLLVNLLIFQPSTCRRRLQLAVINDECSCAALPIYS